ncbi:MAG: CotH kinase family protein [Thermomicrobiales bacterium]|nr:CotH kinase family protein [Thermomicrobiales bacterium]
MSHVTRFFQSLRWKRNRKLVSVLLVGFAVLVLGFGSARVTAITSSERHDGPVDVTIDIQGMEDIFDQSTVHEVTVTFDQDDYDRMIQQYEADGTKDYIEASITIDGTTISSVGLRLKGNSTLRGLSGTSTTTDGQGFPQMQPDSTTDGATPDATPDTTDDTAQPAGGQGFGGMGGGMSSSLSFDDPSSLPWLISFDEFVDGQRYQGYEEIAIRPTTSGTTMLNEALALNLVGEAGQATQLASYSSFTVNGAEAQLRLLVEVPEESYTERNFETDGVLYKALSTGSFSYLGEDPLAYEDAFKQITRKNQQDLEPLIELLKWVDESSDEEFAAHLADYVDVESFAQYIALQDLLNNFDDMSGPGQNYYLWYDLDTGKFSVLTWDLNLAFGQGMGGGNFGGGQMPNFQTQDGTTQDGTTPDGATDQTQPQPPTDGQQVPSGGQVPTDGQTSPDGQMPTDDGTTTDGQTPANGQMPNGGQRPTGGFPGGGQMPNGGQFGGGNAGGMGGNLLKERFLASDAFSDIYAQAYADVYNALYGDGQALAELDALSAVLANSGLVDEATLQSEVEALRSAIETMIAAGPTVTTTTTTTP